MSGRCRWSRTAPSAPSSTTQPKIDGFEVPPSRANFPSSTAGHIAVYTPHSIGRFHSSRPDRSNAYTRRSALLTKISSTPSPFRSATAISRIRLRSSPQ
jgi:hypothetical protein